jgi:hypothetical protein
MGLERPVSMSDGSPPARRSRRLRLAAGTIASITIAGAITTAVALVSVTGEPHRRPPTPALTAQPPPAPTAVPTTVPPSVTASTLESMSPSTTVDPGEPVVDPATEVSSAALAPRPPDLRLEPDALATRFVAEWLTYPPGFEPASALAARLSELTTDRYRDHIVGLSTADTADRPGSAAVLGETSPISVEPAASAVYRVTVWQALYGPSSDVVGPDSWDVTLVRDPTGSWLVDGLRRVG